MINGNLEQFLDTGWYSEAELFYNGYLYWCEASYDEKDNLYIFIVDKWHAENENNTCYHSVLDANGKLDFVRVYEDSDSDIELIKKRFLEATIFDNKTFWQVERELAWLDESAPIQL